MIRKLLLSSAFAAFGTAAMAADAPNTGGAATSVTPPQFTWAGFYLGAQVGGARTRTNLVNTASDGDVAWPDLAVGQRLKYQQRGIIGGGFAGATFQSGNFVYGGELAFSGANLKGGRQNPPGPPFSGGDDVFSSRISNLLTVTGRLGYAIDRALLYVRGGYAGASVRTRVVDSVCPDFAENCGAGSSSKWRSGVTLGAGVEYALTNHWIAGLEYNYVRFGSSPINLSNATAVYQFNDKTRDIHVLQARVSYKF